MTIGLYFGGQGFQSYFGNDLGNIELDAVLDEAHDWAVDATTNPVEDGAPVSDHVIEQPDALRIRCFVSDHPIVASESVSGTYNETSAGSRTQPIFELLNDLIKAREVMTVYTKHAEYSDMILQRVNIPRRADDGEALEFTCDFISIRVVETQTVDVPAGISAKDTAKADTATKRNTQTQKSSGKVQAQTTSQPKVSKPEASGGKPSSTAYKWLNE